MDDPNKKYYDMYDEIFNRYNYEEEGAWRPEMTYPTRQERIVSTQRRLLNILREIADNSGFNTNAPDEMYGTAKRLFGELLLDLDERSKSYEKNKLYIKEAQWALFTKFDYMSARTWVGKIK
tara:strand:+ start:320 stop:685 length:366 start_codon:yes stop_codon:yes gene_type:complete